MKKVLALRCNSRPSAAIAALLTMTCCLTIFVEQQTSAAHPGPAQSPVQDDVTAEIVEQAKNNFPALLQRALANYKRKVRDYTGTLHKQERIKRKLGAQQVISFRFKDKPFSVFMEWLKNPGPADRLLYVEGPGSNKMLVHPTGLLSWMKSLKRHPRSKAARQSTLYTCDQFGFRRLLIRLLDAYRLARQHRGAQTKYLGAATVDGRNCISVEILLPKPQEYQIRRIIVRFDPEYLLPVELERFDSSDNLIGRYTYKDLKFNVGLTDQHFTPEYNNL